MCVQYTKYLVYIILIDCIALKKLYLFMKQKLDTQKINPETETILELLAYEEGRELLVSSKAVLFVT